MNAWQLGEADASGMDEEGGQRDESDEVDREKASGDKEEMTGGYQPIPDEEREARDLVAAGAKV